MGERESVMAAERVAGDQAENQNLYKESDKTWG